MGWPPTKRGSGTAATTGAFTPATSVTTASGRRPLWPRTAATASATALQGRGDEGDLGVGVVAHGVERPARGPGPAARPGRRRAR